MSLHINRDGQNVSSSYGILRGMMQPDVATRVASVCVSHTDNLFASNGRALEFVRFAHEALEAGFGKEASVENWADQCFNATLAFEPLPSLHYDVEHLPMDRKIRLAFVLGCHKSKLFPHLLQDCLNHLRSLKEVTADDTYLVAATWMLGANLDDDVLWRKFQRQDFCKWALPYLVLLEKSLDAFGFPLYQRREIETEIKLRLKALGSGRNPDAVTPRELLDSIRLLLLCETHESCSPYFLALANSTDVMKKCERRAAQWLLEKTRGMPVREDWLNRPHRSNISWMKNRQYVSHV